jgi:hypothetical protein
MTTYLKICQHILKMTTYIKNVTNIKNNNICKKCDKYKK